MEAKVQAELEYVEKVSLEAAKAPGAVGDEALASMRAHAAAALTTLVHVGLITPEEDRQWRERLAPVLGEELRRGRFRIIRADDQEPAEPRPELEAWHAYAICRDLDLTDLAWSMHTAADEDAIVAAHVANAIDGERVRRACRLGFADRGKRVVERHDL